jgi:hypothetical protein
MKQESQLVFLWERKPATQHGQFVQDGDVQAQDWNNGCNCFTLFCESKTPLMSRQVAEMARL